MERVWPRPRGPHLLRGLHLHIRLHCPRHHHLHLLLQDHQDHQVQGKLPILTLEGATPELHTLLLAPLSVVVCQYFSQEQFHLVE